MNGACDDNEFQVAELVDGTLAPEKARIVRLGEYAVAALAWSFGDDVLPGLRLPR